MSKIILNGGNKLYGEVNIDNAKNAMLPLISACIMLETRVTFINCPKLDDILVMLEIIKSLGGNYEFIENKLIVDTTNLNSYLLPCDLAKKIRASIFMVGPLISRFKKATFCAPGGCNIGTRQIDIHIDGFKKLGVEVLLGDIIYCEANKISGSSIELRYQSVGATLNVLMASIFCDGKTVIKNAAREPEITCLCNFLKLFNAKIYGVGTSTLVVEGVKKLNKKQIEFNAISDRIEVGTFLLLALNCGGEIILNNANYLHNEALIKKIQNNACKITLFNDKIYIKSCGHGNSLGKVKTAPYPLFPTDLQSQLSAYAVTLKGTTIIEETVFDDRFKQLSELSKMGANVKINKNVAIINGVEKLEGKEITAYDLRGGAAMIIAGLRADGTTIINNAEIIDRGYFKIENKIRALGANVEKVE